MQSVYRSKAPLSLCLFVFSVEVRRSTALIQDSCPCLLYVNIVFVFCLFLDDHVLSVCLLTACLLPKASAPAVTNAEESGRHGMHVSLDETNHCFC